MDHPQPDVGALVRVSFRHSLAGRHEEARRTVEDGLAAVQDLPSRASLLEHLSGVLARSGDLEAAEQASRQALCCWQDLAEEDAGRYRDDLARAWQHLGNRLLALDRAEEAAAAQRRALDLLDADHAQRPGALNSLAVCLGRFGRHAAARNAARQAADLLAALDDEPTTRLRLAQVLANLSDHHAALREMPEAAATCVQATEILEELYRADPARYGTDLVNVLPRTASRLERIGDLQAAAGIAVRCAEVIEARAGAAPDPKPGRELVHVASFLMELERHEEAARILRRAEALCADLPGARAIALGGLSWCQYRLGDAREAVRTARGAVALAGPGADADSPYPVELGIALTDLSHHLRACGRLLEALEAASRATVLFERLSADDPAHVRGLCAALREKARALTGLGRHAQARSLADRADALDPELSGPL